MVSFTGFSINAIIETKEFSVCGDMASTKKSCLFVIRHKHRPDSGICSDSGLSEAEVPLRCHDDSFSDGASEFKFKPCSAQRNGTGAKSHQRNEQSESRSNVDKDTETHLPDDVKEFPDTANEQYYDTNVKLEQYKQDATGKGQHEEMHSVSHDSSSSEQSNFYAKQGDELKNSDTIIKSHIYASIDSLTPYPMLTGSSCNRQEAPGLNTADIEVINRCDGLINQLQDFTQKYNKLADSYRKNRRLFFILAIVNLTLIACVLIFVPILMFAPRGRDGRYANASSETAASTHVKRHRICFYCSELESDSTFSLETVMGVTLTDGECCFKSILSVMQSQKWNFQTALEESTKTIKSRISEIDRRLLQIEIGSAPDTNAIIGNILQALAPREKTVLYLRSPRGTPFGKDHDPYTKITWNVNDSSSILRGDVYLDSSGANIKINSEGYYFIYTKIQLKHKPRDTYNQNWPLSYLINRKRGSISTYVQEAKVNCIYNDMTQEHSSTSELVLHLNRYDEIFISVEDADKDFLSTDRGAHMFGLFEI